MRRGEASINLSTGRQVDVGGGDEMRAELTRRNTIKPGSLRVEEAHFDSVEESFWERGARSWFPLSVESAGSGAGIVVSNPVGIECGDDCDESYTAGTVVSLTAKPFGSAEFVGWSGDCEGTARRCVSR